MSFTRNELMRLITSRSLSQHDLEMACACIEEAIYRNDSGEYALMAIHLSKKVAEYPLVCFTLLTIYRHLHDQANEKLLVNRILNKRADPEWSVYNYYVFGLIALDSKNVNQAIGYFRQALTRDPYIATRVSLQLFRISLKHDYFRKDIFTLGKELFVQASNLEVVRLSILSDLENFYKSDSSHADILKLLIVLNHQQAESQLLPNSPARHANAIYYLKKAIQYAKDDLSRTETSLIAHRREGEVTDPLKSSSLKMYEDILYRSAGIFLQISNEKKAALAIYNELAQYGHAESMLKLALIHLKGLYGEPYNLSAAVSLLEILLPLVLSDYSLYADMIQQIIFELITIYEVSDKPMKGCIREIIFQNINALVKESRSSGVEKLVEFLSQSVKLDHQNLANEQLAYFFPVSSLSIGVSGVLNAYFSRDDAGPVILLSCVKALSENRPLSFRHPVLRNPDLLDGSVRCMRDFFQRCFDDTDAVYHLPTLRARTLQPLLPALSLLSIALLEAAKNMQPQGIGDRDGCDPGLSKIRQCFERSAALIISKGYKLTLPVANELFQHSKGLTQLLFRENIQRRNYVVKAVTQIKEKIYAAVFQKHSTRPAGTGVLFFNPRNTIDDKEICYRLEIAISALPEVVSLNQDIIREINSNGKLKNYLQEHYPEFYRGIAPQLTAGNPLIFALR